MWVDLYNCDPVTIYFGAQGAGSQTVDFNGAFSMDFQHTYTAAGIYPVKAVMTTCPGDFTDDAPLSVGGIGQAGGSWGLSGPYDDSGLATPAIFAALLGVVALPLAASAGAVGAAGGAGPRKARSGALPGSSSKPYIPFTQPHLQGMPYMESTHWGSLRDIPPGAQRVDPGRIPFVPGTPTDISQAPRDECGELIYTVAGWFCPNPNCIHRNTGGFLTAFPRIGEFYG